MLNRKDIARLVAHKGGYGVGDIEEVLKDLEDVIVDVVSQGEDIKLGKLLKINIVDVAEKRCYNGLDKVYFNVPAKRVPKLQMLSKLSPIELPPKGTQKED